MKYTLAFFILLSPFLANVSAEELISLNKDKWEILQYSSIKPNVVDSNKQSLIIRVDESAAPIFYRLKKPKVVNEIVLDAEVMGDLKLNKSKQGAKGNDDFSLRIGLVYQGEKRLGFFQKQMAAPWVKKLYSLAPKNIGVSHVEFFTVFQDKRLANTKNTSSDLMVDSFVIEQPSNGKIQTTIKVPSNKTVMALWVNSDGDDTKSKFAVKINKLMLR